MKQVKKYFLLAVVFFATACTVSRNSNSKIKFAHNPVVAHRGAYLEAGLPENSIASLQRAIELKYTGSEFDVWMTADDSLVIHHDPDFNKLKIEKSSFDMLQQFRLSNGERLPTLREYLLAGKTNNHSTRLILEIKPSGISKSRGIETTDKVLQLVNVLKCEALVTYISFDYDILKHIHASEPTAITQYLNGDIAPAILKSDGINGADYHYSVYRKNPGWIQEAKDNHIILNAWTVDDTTNMQWLLENHFDFITTNNPGLLLEIFSVKH